VTSIRVTERTPTSPADRCSAAANPGTVTDGARMGEIGEPQREIEAPAPVRTPVHTPTRAPEPAPERRPEQEPVPA